MLFRRSSRFGFTFVFALVLLVGWAAIFNTRLLVRSEQWVAHTHQVLETLARLLLNLADLESANRGFVATGDERYLEPCRSSQRAAAFELRRLATLTKDNPEEQARLARLSPLASAHIESIARIVEARRKGGEATRSLILEELPRMEAIRTVAAEMRAAERRLLDRRDEESTRMRRIMDGTVVFGSLFTLFLLSAGLWKIRVELRARRLAEAEALQAKMEAEAASKAKSAFLANMSHEIRTPMNGVVGMTELALQTDLTVQQQEYLRLAHSSAHALLDLINGILDFSKIEAGKFSVDAIAFDLGEWLSNLMKPLGLRAAQKRIHLLYRIAPDVPLCVRGDQARLRQVVINLVGNAIKFTREGEVLLTIEKQGASGSHVFLNFSVTDTGIGIPPEKLESIFRPFEQVDMSSTREFGGSGLGLAISKRIVQKMGGVLDVESTPGEGSTFRFSIPLEVTAASEPRRDFTALEGVRILAVDDNATNRRLLEETFRLWRVNAFLAAGSAEALSELDRAREQGHPFGLILLDYLIAEGNGLALAAQIRARPGCAETKMLMLSSGIVDLEEALAKGISAVLMKPVGRSELFDSVVTALGQHGVARPKPEVPKSTAPLSILLVEDNAVNREVARAMLTLRGHCLSMACDGQEGVAAVRTGSFDVILMDLQMPQMDGFEAAAAIRALELETGRRHTPILALTAHAAGDVRDQCLISGMDGYISKPFRQAELIGAIEQFCANRPD